MWTYGFFLEITEEQSLVMWWRRLMTCFLILLLLVCLSHTVSETKMVQMWIHELLKVSIKLAMLFWKLAPYSLSLYLQKGLTILCVTLKMLLLSVKKANGWGYCSVQDLRDIDRSVLLHFTVVSTLIPSHHQSLRQILKAENICLVLGSVSWECNLCSGTSPCSEKCPELAFQLLSFSWIS